MVRLITKFILLTLLLMAPAAQVWAQDTSVPPAETRTTGPRKQIATIVFAGLAGAVLGLSTLSFYGRPQDKLSNIAVGFAIGVISGTVYTTYKAATVLPEAWNEMEPRAVGAEKYASIGLYQQSWSF